MKNPIVPMIKERSFCTEIIFLFKMMLEYLRASLVFHKKSPCITIFGSARFTEDHRFYQLAQNTSHLLAEHGYYIMTGGGPGIMEAANRGAHPYNRSLGCGITIPNEQSMNPYLDYYYACRYFFVRKVLLAKFSQGFIVAPGGFGTLDEFFEILTLTQTEKMPNTPIILMTKEYWQPLMDFVKNTLIKNATVSADDANNLYLADTPEEALKILQTHTGPS